MINSDHLFIENNVISLRTAFVRVIDIFVSFSLAPADVVSKMPTGRKWFRPQDFDWMSEDRVLLYRQVEPVLVESKHPGKFPSLEPLVRPMSFKSPPVFKLSWTDSGNSVALYMNGEPWAFIDETSHCGYSKGMLKEARSMRPWNQLLFEKTFK